MPDVLTVSMCAHSINVGEPPLPTRAMAFGRPGAASSIQLSMPRVLNQSRITAAIFTSPESSSGARSGFTDGVRN